MTKATKKTSTANLFSGGSDNAVHVGGHMPREYDSYVSVNDLGQVTNLYHTQQHSQDTTPTAVCLQVPTIVLIQR